MATSITQLYFNEPSPQARRLLWLVSDCVELQQYRLRTQL